MNKLMNKRNLMIVGGGLALLFLYMRYRNGQSSTSGNPPTDTMGTTSSDPLSSDYATLAGNEQQIAAQESSDFLGLQNTVQGLQSLIQGDASAMAKMQREIDRLRKGERHRHSTRQHPGKAGGKHRHQGASHVNQHHPKGTAGHSVASRSHGAHRPGGHPAGTHHPAHHTTTPHRHSKR